MVILGVRHGSSNYRGLLMYGRAPQRSYSLDLFLKFLRERFSNLRSDRIRGLLVEPEQNHALSNGVANGKLTRQTHEVGVA
jgi:hypothetical protein